MIKNLSLLSLCFLVGCSSIRGFPPTENIVNFDKVNDNLYRGGQPNYYGVQFLKSIGIKTVINLRMADDTLKAEEIAVVASGISYMPVPMKGFGRPTNRFLTLCLLFPICNLMLEQVVI